MKSKFKKFGWLIISYTLPVAVFAGPANSPSLPNPLGSTTTIYDFIIKILDVVVKIGTIVVVLAFIYSGFKFVKAQGNSDALEEAKVGFTYTAIGAAVILGAWTLAKIIDVTIHQVIN